MKNFNIPNLLSIFRILLVPVFIYYYRLSLASHDFLIPLVIIVVSGLSDFLDGYIARKYHQITEFGKVLDPIADKLTQFVIVFCMIYRFPLSTLLFIILILKDGMLLVNGLYFLKKGKKLDGAKWYGKVATTVFYVTAFILLLIPHLSNWFANLCIIVTSICMLISLIMYGRVYYDMKKSL